MSGLIKEKNTTIVFDNLSLLLMGTESQRVDLDFLEIMNTLQLMSEHENVQTISILVNRDLLDECQRFIYREHKQNLFNYVFEVNRNEAGYNMRDVHGQLNVI